MRKNLSALAVIFVLTIPIGLGALAGIFLVAYGLAEAGSGMLDYAFARDVPDQEGGARTLLLRSTLHGVELILLAPLLPTAVVAVTRGLRRKLAPTADGRSTAGGTGDLQGHAAGAAGNGTAQGSRQGSEAEDVAGHGVLHDAERIFVTCLGAVIATDMASRLLVADALERGALLAESAALLTVSLFLWTLSGRRP